MNDLWKSSDLPQASWGQPQYNKAKWERWAECLHERDQTATHAAAVAIEVSAIIDDAEAALEQYL